jgi:serine/threonine protein kinase
MDFIAPEQTRNAAAVDRRADVYSLGCTLYSALVGQVPFPGGDSKEKIRRHRTEAPTSLRTLRPEVPPEFAALVHRMMAKDPNQRPATCREVVDALRNWVGAETVLPLDQPSDADYQAALVQAAVSADQQASATTVDVPIVERTDAWRSDSWPGGFQNFWLAMGLAAALVALIAGALLLSYQAGWLR